MVLDSILCEKQVRNVKGLADTRAALDRKVESHLEVVVRLRDASECVEHRTDHILAFVITFLEIEPYGSFRIVHPRVGGNKVCADHA